MEFNVRAAKLTSILKSRITNYYTNFQVDVPAGKAMRIFLLNILVLFLVYSLTVYFTKFWSGNTTLHSIKFLLLMAEASAIYFCFFSSNDLCRFQGLVSLVLSYFTIKMISDPISTQFLYFLYLLFLILEFCLVKYRKTLPLKFLFIVVLISFFFLSPDIFSWGFSLVIVLILLFILSFLFQTTDTSSPALFVSLVFVLIPLVLLLDWRWANPSFRQQILFLGSGSSAIYFCFFSTRSIEHLITSILYFLFNLLIGGMITKDPNLFVRNSGLYLICNGFIFIFLYVKTWKTEESLLNIVEQAKVRICVTKLVVLLMFLDQITREEWVWVWMQTFASQIAILNLFLFFFNKRESDCFHTLEREQTTFLFRIVIYGFAFLLFLMNPSKGFILLINPLFLSQAAILWQNMFTKK